jgi:hypothetical protein
MDYDLGYFDPETLVLERSKIPSAKSVTYVAGTKTWGSEVFGSRVECLLAPRSKIGGQ